MRLAVKVAYDGSLFHGSQRQSDDDTGSVEGAVMAALGRIGGSDHNGCNRVWFASRTDAGVSALGNVFAVDTDWDPIDLTRALNANLNGIWCLAYARMRDSQNVRWASGRWYRYHLDPMRQNHSAELWNSILPVFCGRHDFVHLCRKAIDLSGGGDLIALDFLGERFLWNQVRRMVGAASLVLEGRVDTKDLQEVLKGGPLDERTGMVRDRIPTFPPTGLVLMDVTYKDLDFKISREAIEVALGNASPYVWRSTINVIIGSALRSISSAGSVGGDGHEGDHGPVE